jgi:hypothetical protein
VSLGEGLPKRLELLHTEDGGKIILRNDGNNSPKDMSHQNSAGMRRCTVGLVGMSPTTFRRNLVSSSSKVESPRRYNP